MRSIRKFRPSRISRSTLDVLAILALPESPDMPEFPPTLDSSKLLFSPFLDTTQSLFHILFGVFIFPQEELVLPCFPVFLYMFVLKFPQMYPCFWLIVLLVLFALLVLLMIICLFLNGLFGYHIYPVFSGLLVLLLFINIIMGY